MERMRRKRLLHKILIAIATSVSLLLSVKLAFTFISEELWQIRTIYILWIIYLFGIVPVILLFLDKKMNKEGSDGK